MQDSTNCSLAGEPACCTSKPRQQHACHHISATAPHKRKAQQARHLLVGWHHQALGTKFASKVISAGLKPRPWAHHLPLQQQEPCCLSRCQFTSKLEYVLTSDQ